MTSKLASLSGTTQETATGSRSSILKWVKLRYILLIGVLGWAGYYYWYVQHPQLIKLQKQQQQFVQKLGSMQQQHDELIRKVKEFQSDAFVARYASQHYNLVLPGQIPFNVTH